VKIPYTSTQNTYTKNINTYNSIILYLQKANIIPFCLNIAICWLYYMELHLFVLQSYKYALGLFTIKRYFLYSLNTILQAFLKPFLFLYTFYF